MCLFSKLVFFSSQIYPNLSAKTVLLYNRLLRWRQSWVLFATMTLVCFIRLLCCTDVFQIWLIYVRTFSCFIVFSRLLSCDGQASLPSSLHRTAGVSGSGSSWVYSSGAPVALWHAASAAGVAPHQRPMCRRFSAPRTLPALLADGLRAAWWRRCPHSSLPLAQKGCRHCRGHSQVETPPVLKTTVFVIRV